MADKRRFVIVGGGLAGAKGAEALREQGFDGEIELYAAEPHLPYERPPLSKAYLKTGENLAEAFVHERSWYAAHGVQLHLGHAREPGRRSGPRHRDRVGGADRPTTGCCWPPGASPRRISLPGADLDGVLYLRTIEDSDRLRAAFKPGARVVFVGGGWIGLEVASAAREAGADVTVLESLELPLVRVLGAAVAEVFADLHREHGVDLRTSVHGRASIEGDAGRGERGACSADGTRLPADAVVVGIGAAPNVELAEAAGLEVDNGVLVDAQGRTSDPDIFAVGRRRQRRAPVPRAADPRRALGQRAQPAGRGRRGACSGEAGLRASCRTSSPTSTTSGMEYLGLGSPDDEVVVRGDLAAREFVAFWLRDGRVTAGMNVNVWDVGDADQGR